MTRKHRLIRAGLLAIFTAAAIARAELGADAEASAIFTPAFAAGLPPAFLGGWLVAGQFGAPGAAGWLRAGLAGLAVLLVSGVVAALLSPLLGGLDDGPLGLLAALPRWPLAWGAALAGVAAVQVVALRQGRTADQSRK